MRESLATRSAVISHTFTTDNGGFQGPDLRKKIRRKGEGAREFVSLLSKATGLSSQ